MSQQDKPREFWVDFAIGGHLPSQQTTEVSMNKLSYPYRNVIHVIEYSAYESLKAENQKLRDELTKYSGMTMSESDARVQLATLQESNKALVEALEKYADEGKWIVVRDFVGDENLAGLELFEYEYAPAQKALEQYKNKVGE